MHALYSCTCILSIVVHASPQAAAAAQALEDLVDAVGEVKALQERTVQADRSALIDVSVQVTSTTEFPSFTTGCPCLTTFGRTLLGAQFWAHKTSGVMRRGM